MTRGFTDLLGRGRFGNVYKGRLKDGTAVAIKRILKKDDDGFIWEAAQKEVDLLSKVRHANVVRLIDYLKDNDEYIIVYEFISNGTLHKYLDGLHGVLDFSSRLGIAIEVANALVCLHFHTEKPIVHLNVKLASVLLTEGLEAKLTGFDLATELDAEETHSKVKGTPGYVDPAFVETGLVTIRSDVYSFGVLLIEIFSSERVIDQNRLQDDRDVHLLGWARKQQEEGHIVDVLDSKLPRTFPTLCAWESICELALQCTSDNVDDRPTMKEVVVLLENIEIETIWNKQQEEKFLHELEWPIASDRTGVKIKDENLISKADKGKKIVE